MQLYELYQKMLANMGPTGWWPAEQKAQILVEAILIQNTTEKNATKASQLIDSRTQYQLETLIALEPSELAELVRPAGFMKNKTKAIQSLAQWVVKQNSDWQAIASHHGTNLRHQLLSIFGVGAETADVLLVYLFDQPAFVADKYARTLFTELGITDLTDYRSLHQRLAWLPAPFTYQDAQEFHGLIDEFGKQYFGRQNRFAESFLAGEKLTLNS